MNMGAFGENFPYTNFHELNLDWMIKIIKDFEDHKTEIVDGLNTKLNKPTTNGNPNDVLISLGNGETEWVDLAETYDIVDIVDQWLEDHPEATTTVQDRSITAIKLTEQLENQVINNYVTPQMFGAVGDGTTDDTGAIQLAINYSHTHNYIPVCFISDYRITNTINVPERVTIFSLTLAEYKYRLLVDSNVSIVFNCEERVTFQNIIIDGLNNTYRDNTTAFAFSGSNSHDADSKVINCQIVRMGKGAYCPSRNVDFINCLFSHCRYGIHIDIPSGIHGLRGMNIQGCRFHGIGEEFAMYEGELQEILTTGICSGILLSADNYTNYEQEADIIIQNCISDQSGTFITGYAQFCLITDCYVKSFAHPSIIIDGGSDGVLHPSSAGSWLISNCMFNGVNGLDGAGVEHDRPDNLITISRYGRVTISDCIMGKLKGNPFKISNGCTDITIMNNIMTYTSNGTTFIEISGGSKVICKNNTNTSGTTISIVTGSANDTESRITSTGNMNFTIEVNANSFKNIFPYSGYQTITTITSGTAVPGILNVPQFFVRRADGKSVWKLEHWMEGYYTSTAIINQSTGRVETIEIEKNTNKIYLVTTDGTSKQYDGSTQLYIINVC